MSQYPEPIVGAFIINSQGEFFLIRSHKWPDFYSIPGGHIELGETIEAALKREVFEETGLTIFKSELFHIQESIFNTSYWKKKHFIFLNHLCWTKDTNVTLNDEIEEYVWEAPEKATKYKLDQFTKNTIQKYLQERATTSSV